MKFTPTSETARQEVLEYAIKEMADNQNNAVKTMIIENFMLWFTGELTEEMQCFINEYVEDDHVNELRK
jgi:hypothetical protein